MDVQDLFIIQVYLINKNLSPFHRWKTPYFNQELIPIKRQEHLSVLQGFSRIIFL